MERSLTILCCGREFNIPKRHLAELDLFDKNGALLSAPSYSVNSHISADVFSTFAASVCGRKAKVSSDNFADLTRVCHEFGYHGLDDEISDAKASAATMLAYQSRLESFESALNDLRSEIAGLRNLDARVSALECSLSEPVSDRVPNFVIPDSSDRSSCLDALRDSYPADSGVKIFELSSMCFDGIIAHLTRTCSGNVHDQGVVEVTSNSTYGGHAARNALDVGDSGTFYWSDYDGHDQWLCIDFKERRVQVTHYAIQNSGIMSWVLEGSMDGTEWTEIDRRDDNNDLEFNDDASFAVTNPEAFRFVRLRQTGENHSGDDDLILSAIEFFGTLIE